MFDKKLWRERMLLAVQGHGGSRAVRVLTYRPSGDYGARNEYLVKGRREDRRRICGLRVLYQHC